MPTKLVILGETRIDHPGGPASLLNLKAPLLETWQVDSLQKKDGELVIDVCVKVCCFFLVLVLAKSRCVCVCVSAPPWNMRMANGGCAAEHSEDHPNPSC